jgi:myosin heavy subunit
LNSTIVALSQKVRHTEEQTAKAVERMHRTEHSKRAVQDEAKNMVDHSERKVEALREKHLQLQKTTAEQETRLEEAWHRAHQAERAEMQIAQLQEKIHSQATMHERAMVRAETLHKTETERLMGQLRSTNTLGARNDQLEATVKQLRKELASYKQNLKLAKYTTAEAKADHAEQALLRAQQELAVLRERHRKMERLAEDRGDRITEMKVAYNKMFDEKKKRLAEEAARQNSSAMVRAMTAEEIKAAADNNPAYAQFYKKKLKASEARVAELTGMLKQFMMSDHKSRAMLRSSRTAAQRYQLELDGVKNALHTSESTRDAVELRMLNMEKERMAHRHAKESGRRQRRNRPQSARAGGMQRSNTAPAIGGRRDLLDTHNFRQASSSIRPNTAMGSLDSNSSVVSMSIEKSGVDSSTYDISLSLGGL